jgi:hypothetical protein
MAKSPKRVLRKSSITTADFAIKVEFEPGTPDPARVFRAMTQLIDTFQRFDRELVQTIDSHIQPVLLLENVEAGSVKTWLRAVLESVDETALKDGDWKKVVGHYLVRAKYLLVDFLEKKTEIKGKAEIDALRGEILGAAELTTIKRIPAYTPPSNAVLVRTITDLNAALAPLQRGDAASFQTVDGESVPFNLGLKVVPESLNELLIERTIGNTEEMILKIKKPDFLGDSQWEFVYDTSFEAKVLDNHFLKQFRSNEISLQPGSAIRALLYVEVGYGYEREVVSRRRQVVKVLEVIPPPDYEQEKLLIT